MKYKRIIKFIEKLAKKLNIFYKKRSNVKLLIKNKSKHNKKFDPVTNLDKIFERFIRQEISKNFSNHSIIGEEFKDLKKDVLNKWSIDPIDGTKAFIIGSPTWSNLVSFSELNRSLFGLANFPDLNKYYVNNEKKSFVVTNNKKIQLKTSKTFNLKKTKIIGNFHGTISHKKQQKIIKKFGWSFRLASYDALNYCLLAEGKVDAVVEAGLKPYDILPLIPIIENSGGIVTTWEDQSAENGGKILASANLTLHKRIIRLLKPFSSK
tara:strand:+ start:2698 stop:3492 length:795 start_codon:yes stop_codon:yes gene_type:complete